MKLAVFALLLVVLPLQAEARPYVCDTLTVIVIEADSLSGDGILNPPDGYVKVTVDGQTKQTSVIHNNLDPVWFKKFHFTNVKSDKLVVEVWEHDDFLHGGDDHLGTCEEKLKPGFYSLHCRTSGGGPLLYEFECLKGK